MLTKIFFATLLMLLTAGSMPPATIGDAPLLLTYSDSSGAYWAGHVYLYDVETEITRRISSQGNSNAGGEAEASIAPDRKHIVWTTANGTFAALEVAQLDENGYFGEAFSSNPTIIMNDRYFDSPVWSPCLEGNTAQLAYVADWQYNIFEWDSYPEIYIQDIPLRLWTEAELVPEQWYATSMPIMRESARTRRRITFNDTKESDLAWSPDGKQIAYISNQHGIPEVYIQDTDGINKHIRRITDNDVWESSPSWSPDGKWLVFSQSGQIVKMEISTGETIQLTTDGYNVLPSWSPDGQYIAYLDAVPGGGTMMLMHSDGSESKTLFPLEGIGSGYPAWVPLPREC